MDLNFLNTKINLIKSKKVFVPNLTTAALLKSLEKIAKRKTNILELGCGSGAIGIILKKYFKDHVNITMTDKSEYATKLAKKNAKKNKVNCNIIQSDLFSFCKSKNILYDLIIDDVAAISNIIAKKSNWYNKFIPHKCGDDGSKLTIKILEESASRLRKRGLLIFPVISLSNYKKIVGFAQKKFKICKLILEVEWPLPKYFDNKILVNLKKMGLISFKEKYGEKICFTRIYKVQN
jgi:precorrin-6B methylase 2